MHTFFYLFIGLIALLPLIVYIEKQSKSPPWYLPQLALVVAAFIYLGFAFIWGSTFWLGVEALGVALYAMFIPLSTRYTLYWLALGWLLHPLWDLCLHLYGSGSHVVPHWYAIACVSFDLGMAAYIVYLIQKHSPTKEE